MARLINTRTEVVVRVSDEKAARLGREWKPVEAEAEKPASRRRTTKKSEK